MVRESWQPIEDLVENAETDTNMKAIEDELVQAEHEETSLEAHVNNNKVHKEHHNDREEFEAVDQYIADDHYSITMRVKPKKKSN